ncbi:cobalamin biosynthesis protein [Wenjunlia tyrosinilytica]|uniref:CobE/GbiG C-terminal domain-containing protein n=1 Tax=Wenjunlia tyrosinilytica TaxID=1544741 RepID=A0A917ZFS2_9ACTN|nr:cobalamin biosynthesis protein [Wenjunlia tyrosinilytica]GGO81289.1 hypothetical protein GCM10012280_05160 [Wenjunlia tyrosinilytica]
MIVVGVGASRGVTAEELLDLVQDTLAGLGLELRAVGRLATVEGKGDEEGLVEAARVLGVPLVTHSAAALAAVNVPNPSDAALAAVGTPSVCEAAALIETGAHLLVPKRRSSPSNGPALCTIAVARTAEHPSKENHP